jgi:hypothetical protein
MKRFLSLALLMPVLLSACGGIPAFNPTATATPLPTDTPEPTFTPTPTNTPTPVPTSTPDIAATQAVEATQAAADVLAELDKNLGSDSDIPYQDGRLIWQQSDPLSVKLNGPSQDFLEIDEEVSAGNFILKSDVKWEATGLLVCGAIFRSESDIEKGKQYMFLFLRFSGLPAWAIEVHQYGQFQNSPTDTRFSDAVDLDNGATNQFFLVVQDDHFTLYMNGQRQGRYYDYSKQRSDGVFGFVGLQSSGKGTCDFKNSWIWSLDQ